MKKVLFVATILALHTATIFANATRDNQLTAYHPYDRTPEKSELKSAAVKNFKKQFADVMDETWSTKEDGLRARFSRNGVKYMVDYNKNGRWVSTIKVYDEKNLSAQIRKIVRSGYVDYNIVKVIEVRIGKRLVHFVKLESPSTLLTLHIMDGDITEKDIFKRG